MKINAIFGVLSALTAIATLSACSGGASIGGTVGSTAPASAVVVTPVTTSAFVLPTGSGAIYAGLSSVEGGSKIDIEGDGYAYQVGATEEGDFAAVAGTVTDGALPAVGTKGEATYSGSYNLVYLNRTDENDVTAMVTAYSGKLTLTADLAAKSFSGLSKEFTDAGSEGSKPVLYTKGTYADGTMEGLVRFRQTDKINIRADMMGYIGANKAVAAFQGGDDPVDAIAGGFNVLAD